MTLEDGLLLAEQSGLTARRYNSALARWHEHRANEGKREARGLKLDLDRFLAGEETVD